MIISYSEYELHPLGSLNSRRGLHAKHGALIRIEKDGQFGYADLCPLTEFGDVSVARQLESIQSDKPEILAQRSLALAEKDLLARQQGKSLYKVCEIHNHWPITDILNFDLRQLANLAIQGFHTLKIKMGHDLQLETMMLRELLQVLKDSGHGRMRVRLDFNESLNFISAQKFLSGLSADEKTLIEFIEDICPYKADDWSLLQSQSGVSLAADLSEGALSGKGDGFDVLVLKPSRQDVDKLVEKFSSKKYVVTHSQDFVIGQLHALAIATELHSRGLSLLTCGLQLHNTFETSVFQSLLSYNGDQIVCPQGAGIGFEEALSSQKWSAL